MKINTAQFITSLAENRDFPGCGLSQIAVAGKSNVGKSSLINSLTNHKKLAKASQQPGMTRLINIYLINEQFHLVDLPGYGYAKVPQSMKEQWGKLMSDFLMQSEPLVHILHLVDIRHDPGALDKQMAAFIREVRLPSTVVATKADKLSKNQQAKAISTIARTLEVDAADIIAYSSASKQGRDALLDRIEHVLDQTSRLA